ncbi:chloramphenicol phosphotransferase [Rhizobium leguminosarum bv. trifolii]|uniref:chloramphenicol phosphotransferase n=1 Tax=Rhizobium ruizarguesonis TaxID=2081791 RepID=UPI001030694A|nr:chloramphenicol phosphotransferase [Rhizobium ruizarguesonis]QIO43706.1 chloramphenicol phosphotransferase [Rhizobium leguminosarum bv. trifolii]QND39079.1 chloramphenicol phosphotransferase [Rhizobium leguminosarum bv. viciae]TAY21408.1 chloramphenicol phosphotransferase [Rhizobium ruizarguesonis]
MGVRTVLLGFPGVGKLTIAKELSAMVSAKIVDNHWVNNPILRLLDEDGTAPLPKGIWEFTGRFRQTVLDAITAYAPSANFIFTLPAWRAAEACDAVLVPVRLLCDEEDLARRVSNPERGQRLKSTDVAASRDRSRRAGVFDPLHPNTLVLDVTSASPGKTAIAIREQILKVLGDLSA